MSPQLSIKQVDDSVTESPIVILHNYGRRPDGATVSGNTVNASELSYDCMAL